MANIVKEEEHRLKQKMPALAILPNIMPKGEQRMQVPSSMPDVVIMPVLTPLSEAITKFEHQLTSNILSNNVRKREENIAKAKLVFPKEPVTWKRIKTVKDFTKGGIIQKNSCEMNAKILEKLTRKDAFECIVPPVSNSLEYDIAFYDKKQKVISAFELMHLPCTDILYQMQLELMSGFVGSQKGFFYAESPVGKFDLDTVGTMLKLHQIQSIKNAVDEELLWLTDIYAKPDSICRYPKTEHVREFQNILYFKKFDEILPDYGMSADDLACLCCNRSLSSMHIQWIVKKLNEMQKETLSIYVHDVDDIKTFVEKQIAENPDKPTALIFIFAVKEFALDGNTESRCFSICHVDSLQNKIIYADSQGLAAPGEFLEIVREIYNLIFDKDIIGFTMSYCHDYRENKNNQHKCSSVCSPHFPLHEHSFISAVVVIAVTAIACLAKEFFHVITETNNADSTTEVFLKIPDKYNSYLRRVLMSWIAKKSIDIGNLVPAPYLNGKVLQTEAAMVDHTAYLQAEACQNSDISCEESTVGANIITAINNDPNNGIGIVVTEENISCEEIKGATCDAEGILNEIVMEDGTVIQISNENAQELSSVSELIETRASENDDDQKDSEGGKSPLMNEIDKGTVIEIEQKSNSPIITDSTNKSDSMQGNHADIIPDTTNQNEEVTVNEVMQTDNGEMINEQNEPNNINEGDPVASNADNIKNISTNLSLPKLQSTPKAGMKQCPYCDRKTSKTYNLKRHISRFHKTELTPETLRDQESGNCVCLECGHRCPRAKEFRNHLVESHNAIFNVEVKTFKDADEFKDWKNRLEERDLCHFVRSAGGNVHSKTNVLYYMCNHSGFYRPSIIDGSRPKRKFGSFKIDNCCTASMRVSIEDDKSLQVEVCYTHYHHGREFRGLWLSLERRRTVMSMMTEGTRDTIIAQARNYLTKEQRTREYKPMRTVFGIDDIMRHASDHLSLLRWIDEWNGLDCNPVLFHKLKGEETSYNDLRINDFVIVIQNDIQKNMMMQFGNNGLLCFSVPCGSYVLTPLSVIDGFGECFPVAICLSSQITDVIVKIYFNQVVKNVEELKPEWFMSDFDDNFYDLFVQITSHYPRRFSFLSSTEKSFRSELAKGKLTDITNEIGVYEAVMKAMLEKNDKVFEDLVWLLLQRRSKKAEAFYDQFTTHWLQRRYQWASCYRPYGLDTCVNEFKCWITERCVKSKVNQRVDTGLINLLTYVRNEFVRRKIKGIKYTENQDAGQEMIEERHSKSFDIPLSCVIAMEDRQDKYEVTDNEKRYTIRLGVENKECKCSIRCKKCDICPHIYICSCPDSVINANICMHAHLIKRYVVKVANGEIQRDAMTQAIIQIKKESSTTEMTQDTTDEQTTKQTDAEMQLSESAEVTCLKEEIKSLLTYLMVEVNRCNDVDKLQMLNNLLSKALDAVTTSVSSKRKIEHVEHLTPCAIDSSKRACLDGDVEVTALSSINSVVEIPSQGVSQICEVSANGSKEKKSKNHDVRKILGLIGLSESNIDQVLYGNRRIRRTDLPIDEKKFINEASDIDIHVMKKYMEKPAWRAFSESVNRLIQEWYCEKCRRSEYKSMVQCEGCDKWFHWNCVSLTEEPNDWYCSGCTETD